MLKNKGKQLGLRISEETAAKLARLTKELSDPIPTRETDVARTALELGLERLQERLAAKAAAHAAPKRGPEAESDPI